MTSEKILAAIQKRGSDASEAAEQGKESKMAWIRSYIRDAEKRELLFELGQARDALFEAHGKSREHDLIVKSVANLGRMWVED